MHAKFRKDKNCGCTVAELWFIIALYHALKVHHANQYQH